MENHPPLSPASSCASAHHIQPSSEHLNAQLVRWLMDCPHMYLFGGLVRHLIDSIVHPTYGDIDVIALDDAVREQLHTQFGYVFREVSPPGSSPRYFLAKSPRVTTPIQLIQMRCHADVMLFTNNAQYDIGRVAYSNHRFYFDPAVGEETIRSAITTKRATLIKAARNMTLFSPNRQQIERRHRWKLMCKGFTIIE